MNIFTNNDDIIIDNKIVFTRKYSDLSFSNKPKKKIKIKDKIKNDVVEPPLFWCINELNGISCKACFNDITEYKYHQMECLHCQNNLLRIEKEKEEKEKEEMEKNNEIDDDTLNIIESYERMTGNNIFMAYLLGQININTINKIKDEYYYDLEAEYFMNSEIANDEI